MRNYNMQTWAKKINAEYESYVSDRENEITHAVTAGRYLILAKDKLKDDVHKKDENLRAAGKRVPVRTKKFGWVEWVEKNCPKVSRQTVSTWMRAATAYQYMKDNKEDLTDKDGNMIGLTELIKRHKELEADRTYEAMNEEQKAAYDAKQENKETEKLKRKKEKAISMLGDGELESLANDLVDQLAEQGELLALHDYVMEKLSDSEREILAARSAGVEDQPFAEKRKAAEDRIAGYSQNA